MQDDLTTAKHNWKKLDNNTTYSFGSNGLTTQGSTGGCYLKLDETYPTDYSVEFTLKDVSGSSNFKTSFGINNTWVGIYSSSTRLSYIGGSETTVAHINVNDVIKITK